MTKTLSILMFSLLVLNYVVRFGQTYELLLAVLSYGLFIWLLWEAFDKPVPPLYRAAALVTGFIFVMNIVVKVHFN